MATYHDAAALLDATRRLQDSPGADLSDIPGVHDGRGEFYAADALGRPLFAGDYVRWRGRALLAAGFIERHGVSYLVPNQHGHVVGGVPSCHVLFRAPPWNTWAEGSSSGVVLAEPFTEFRREQMLERARGLPVDYLAELDARLRSVIIYRKQVAMQDHANVGQGPDGETCGTCYHCQDNWSDGPGFCLPVRAIQGHGDKSVTPACRDWLPVYHWFAHSAAERPFREACLAEAAETTPPGPEILTTAAMVYADWLDEHGSARRAAAIRHCHHLHQRRQLTDVFRLPQIRSSP